MPLYHLYFSHFRFEPAIDGEGRIVYFDPEYDALKIVPIESLEAEFQRFEEGHREAQWCGEKRGALEAAGRTVTQADALIAACAREHGMIPATRNPRDFQGFGIPVINPFD